MSRKSVQEAATALERRGHVQIVSRKGKGVENLYVPILIVSGKAAVASVLPDVSQHLVGSEQIRALTAHYAAEITAIRDDYELVEVFRLPDLSKVFLATFPGPQDQDEAEFATSNFLMFIVYGNEPVDLIEIARAYVARAADAGDRVMGPAEWTRAYAERLKEAGRGRIPGPS